MAKSPFSTRIVIVVPDSESADWDAIKENLEDMNFDYEDCDYKHVPGYAVILTTDWVPLSDDATIEEAIAEVLDRTVPGTQWLSEFSADPNVIKDLRLAQMRRRLQLLRDQLAAEGMDVDALLASTGCPDRDDRLRQAMITTLKLIDRDGDYDDVARGHQGLSPLTVEEAEQHLANWLAEVGIVAKGGDAS